MNNDKLIILYRHGETDRNVEDITMGQNTILDTQFTDKGFDQIDDISKNIKDNEIEVIYSSDIKRAYETAKYANANINVDIIINPAFRGLDMGIYQGLYFKDFITNEHVLESIANHDLPFENGESINQLNERMLNAIMEICNTSDKERIAIFSHSAAISNLKSYLTNEEYDSIKMCCLLFRNNKLHVLSSVPIKHGDGKLVTLCKK